MFTKAIYISKDNVGKPCTSVRLTRNNLSIKKPWKTINSELEKDLNEHFKGIKGCFFVHVTFSFPMFW